MGTTVGDLIFWGVVAAIVAGGAFALRESIYHEGEQAGIEKQAKADNVIVTKLTAERDQAIGANQSCIAKVGEQNTAITVMSKASESARAESAAIIAKLTASSKDTAALIARLRAQASAAPIAGDRNAQCTNADAIAVDALRRMRNQ